MDSSKYINEKRRDYSLYVLQSRAIPSATDGLKAAARRVLWTARDGKKYKSATLAGATMPIHPHASPEGTINTLAAPYGNNIPLLEGHGAFGTLLNPGAYGASRYTSANISSFTKDVMFADIEIIPMMENYDSTLEEPVHFLPLIPMALLNPTEGIAIGFASNILPRNLQDIIEAQITCLTKKRFSKDDVFPYFKPFDMWAKSGEEGNNGNMRWAFEGTFKKLNTTEVTVTKLPYGTNHEKYTNILLKMLDNDEDVVDYKDKSKNKFEITIKFKRGVVDSLSKSQMLKKLGLTSAQSENMNVLTLDGQNVWSTDFWDMVEHFTKWRLEWYVARYERLLKISEDKIQRYKDILIAIRKNVGGVAKKIGSRTELKDFLKEIKIVNIDYIADLPVYRFTENEKKKVEMLMVDENKRVKEFKDLLTNPDKRAKIYVNELKQVLKKYG